MKHRFVSIAVPLLLVVLGLGVAAYPLVSNWLFERSASKTVTVQDEAIARASEQRLAELRAEAEAYNENLAGDPVHDPFVPGSGYALPGNYAGVLNVNGDGVMGSIEIPSIGVSLPIYHGTSEDILAKGVGHIEQTALPIGGEGRHSVLTGHRGLPSAELFSRLDELDIGDQFYITVLGETLAYEVDQIDTVLPDELATLATERGRDLVTLVTCTPYGVNTHRLLVRGARVPYDPEVKQQAEQSGWRPTPYEAGLAAGAAVLACLMGVSTVRRRVRGRRIARGAHAR